MSGIPEKRDDKLRSALGRGIEIRLSGSRFGRVWATCATAPNRKRNRRETPNEAQEESERVTSAGVMGCRSVSVRALPCLSVFRAPARPCSVSVRAVHWGGRTRVSKPYSRRIRAIISTLGRTNRGSVRDWQTCRQSSAIAGLAFGESRVSSVPVPPCSAVSRGASSATHDDTTFSR